MALELGLKHRVSKYYKDCSNDDLMTLTYFMAKSNMGKYNTCDFMEMFEDFGLKIGN